MQVNWVRMEADIDLRRPLTFVVDDATGIAEVLAAENLALGHSVINLDGETRDFVMELLHALLKRTRWSKPLCIVAPSQLFDGIQRNQLWGVRSSVVFLARRGRQFGLSFVIGQAHGRLRTELTPVYGRLHSELTNLADFVVFGERDLPERFYWAHRFVGARSDRPIIIASNGAVGILDGQV